MRRIESLSPEDFIKFPIWKFASGGGILGGESLVDSITDKDVHVLSNCIVGTQLTLSNGAKCFGILGNIDVLRPTATEHFLTASFFKEGSWFHLARYHDIDYDRRGPNQLASFLGLEVDQIFPISYQIDCVGGLPSIDGIICKNPPRKLSEADLIQLAIDSD